MINISSNSVFINNGETDYIVTVGALNVNSISSNLTVIISTIPQSNNNISNNNLNFSLALSQISANDIVSNTYLQHLINEYVRNDKLLDDINDLDNGGF